MTLADQIREDVPRLAGLHAGGPAALAAAVLAVLDVCPPGTDGMSPADAVLVLDGWATCHTEVVTAVAQALGIEEVDR